MLAAVAAVSVVYTICQRVKLYHNIGAKINGKVGDTMGDTARTARKYAVFIGLYCVIKVAWGAKGHEFKSRPSDQFQSHLSDLNALSALLVVNGK